jgi:hypothetical protein
MAKTRDRQVIPKKVPTDTVAEAILKDLEPLVAFTPTERDAFEWAYWPTLDLAETKDAQDEMRETGTTLKLYLYEDMAERLGEMLPDMAESTQGEPDYRKNKAKARSAEMVADRIKERIYASTDYIQRQGAGK